MTRTDAIARARRMLQSGEFLAELERRVAYQTESQNPDKRDALRAYLTENLQPAFSHLGFATRLIESPTGQSPYLLAEYRESATAPTVLMYGHGDVVDGMTGDWRDDRDPWQTTIAGNRVYGRGTADNKGQHSINMSALRAVREAWRPARLQCQVSDRDRGGDRIAGFAPGLPRPLRRAESRSAACFRRAAAFRGTPDAFPRLPRRNTDSSGCELA